MNSNDNDPPAIRIRRALKKDLPVLVDFLSKLTVHVAGGTSHTLKEAEKKKLKSLLGSALQDEHKQVIVAETADDGLVGMGDISIWRSQSIWDQLDDVEFRSGIIDDVWVEPDYRGLGVFRAILRELVAFAEENDVHELILEYSLANKEADTAWRKLGFTPTGVRAAAFTSAVRQSLSESE